MSSFLHAPVSTLAKQVFPLRDGCSLLSASEHLRAVGTNVAPVANEHAFVGLISEEGIARALESGVSMDSSVSPWLDSNPLLVLPGDTAGDALNRMRAAGHLYAAVVDARGGVSGIVTPSDLYRTSTFRPHMPTTGGLATPFGVYLTTGSVWAGPRPWGLVSTGAYMAVLMIAAKILSSGIAFLAFKLGSPINSTISDLIILPIFGLLMRFSPLAGIHAAEHMTVWAIERGESVSAEVVKRMPRVHPRCGTNLATAAIIISFFGLQDFGLSDWAQSIQFILVFVIAWFGYRRIGGFVQYWFTTKPPNAKQVEMGCKTGRELIEKVARSSDPRGPVWKVIWNSGIFYVIAGGWVTVTIIYFAFAAFHRSDLVSLN